MKDGAYDFITKPFRGEQLIKLVDKALERRGLIEQNKALKKQLEDLRAQATDDRREPGVPADDDPGRPDG